MVNWRLKLALGVAAFHIVTAPFGIHASLKNLDDVDYVVNESAIVKPVTLGFGDYYRVHEGNDYGLESQVREIQTNYNGKITNLYISDNYRIENAEEQVREDIDGHIFSLTTTQMVFTPKGEEKGIVHRRMFNFLIPTIAQKIFQREGFYVRVDGNIPLRLRPTWKSALLSTLREYDIQNPDTGEMMGKVRNNFTIKQFIGAHHYQIDIFPEYEGRLELDDILKAIQIEDRIEDRGGLNFSFSSDRPSK